MSLFAADLKADGPGTKEVLSAIFSKISRGRTTQALGHDHTQFVCTALQVWKPMQIHQGRSNLIKALQAKDQSGS